MIGDITAADDIYIVCGYTDMRKSIDGLCAMEKKEGSNIRNLIAHGLMGEQEISFSCIYFICAVYKLLFYNSRNALNRFIALKDNIRHMDE